MLKAVVNYSKKVPVPDSEYSSQGYSLSLETEIPESDPAAIAARLHDTFELVKASVEQELANGKVSAHVASRVPAAAQPIRSQASDASRDSRRDALPPQRQEDEKASNRQIKFITDLASRGGMTLVDLNADIRDAYGVGGLYDLSRKQASSLLDRLNTRNRKAA